MSTTFALVLAAFAPGQAAETDIGPAVVRLARGQELVYRGTAQEESSSSGSVSSTTYEVETHVFVLHASAKEYQLAFQTVLRTPGSMKPGSVRLEQAKATPRGKLTFDSGDAARPAPDSPPTLEPAGVVELTPGPHPVEYVRGTRCVRLTRTESVAGGARVESAWVAVETGLVRKLERTFERRTGGERPSSFKTTTACELAGELALPDALAAGRRREIGQAWQAQQRLATLLPQAGKVGPLPFDRVLVALTGHVESQAATPYRPAVLWLQDRAAAGKRGETPAPGNP